MGKRELVAFFCLPDVSRLLCAFSLRLQRVCLQFMIVVFPDPTHYFFAYILRRIISIPCETHPMSVQSKSMQRKKIHT